MSVPTTPTPMTASTKNSPMSRSSPTRPGPIGTTRSATRYGSRATAGASRKIVRSAAAGTTSSFCTNLTPSATSCAQPWKAPAYIGPTRLCMCAIALCSTCPTTRGTARKATSTTRTRSTTGVRSASSSVILLPATRPHRTPGAGRLSNLGHGQRVRRVRARWPRSPLLRVRGSSGPGAASRGSVVAGLAALTRLLGARPRFGHSGREHELLAQRVTLELVRQQQRLEVENGAVRGEVDAEHLVGLALVPAGTGEHLSHGLDHGCLAWDQGLQDQVVDRSGAVRSEVADDPEAVCELVDGAQPVEERAAELVARERDRLDPAVRGYVDGDRAEPFLDHRTVREGSRARVTDPTGERVHGCAHRAVPGSGSTSPLVTDAASVARNRSGSTSPSIFS